MLTVAVAASYTTGIDSLVEYLRGEMQTANISQFCNVDTVLTVSEGGMTSPRVE